MRNYNEKKISIIPQSYFDKLGGKIIDIGCNECILPEKLKLNKKDYLGFDIDFEALSIARKKGYQVKNLDLNKKSIRLKSNSIDSFICLDILEHLQDPIKTVKDIKRISKNDAVGIISLPNDLNLTNLIKILFFGKSLVIKSKIWDPYTHLHFPSISESKKLIEKHFEIILINYVPSNFTVPFLPLKFKIFLASILPRLFAQNVIFLVKNKK